ncbi:hypothetical protein HPB48_025077 [Haemaphysalis longicornis]|uniref:1-acylglycerol-3-phosphate O-acyltransferase n=1 Tax=Haemaphysalis longicornis TaxID=44386 RepID=A0A9J6H9U0_HAELO|nr:hypothetical protein HPB48_025077 [Haemaphysalis longicornis]
MQVRVNDDDRPLMPVELRSVLRLGHFSGVARFNCPGTGCGLSAAAFMTYYKQFKTCGPLPRHFRARHRLLFGVGFKVLHAERLASVGNCTLVANHQNSLDIIGIVCHWRLFHPCVPVMKKWFLYSGPVGFLCWLTGSVFIDRSNGRRGREALNAKLRDVSDGKVCAFHGLPLPALQMSKNRADLIDNLAEVNASTAS